MAFFLVPMGILLWGLVFIGLVGVIKLLAKVE